ncbi:MAG: hypothetical protein ACXACO_04025 [Promethearchaeota archaeon]|jgi:hypothetical protein
MKIYLKKRKVYPLIAISMFLLFNSLYLTTGIAYHMGGEGVTFDLDEDIPIGYGVIIPLPNMYATLSVMGSNQGEFAVMEWDGSIDSTQTINYAGEDISLLYPWYFDGYVMDSTTNNGYIDPWSIRWLNVSAFNAGNNTLFPFTVNTVFNYHVMQEGGNIIIPLNNSMPMQIDLIVTLSGPKILKFDWLTNNPAAVVINDFNLISPSGKIVAFDWQTASTTVMVATDIFDYFAFVANEVGTYRILVDAFHTQPAYLNMEFLDTSISSLNLNTLTFGGNSDENPSLTDFWDIEWQNNWFEIKGEKGDLFRLDLGLDYSALAPIIDVWLPCENGYVLDQGISVGVYDLYFPTSGNAYVSLNDADYGGWYRYSLFLSEIGIHNYTIGIDKTMFRVSRDERKAIEFSIEQDSFVRFNYTIWGTPPGAPTINALGTNNAFIYEDSKNFECYDVISAIETKTVGSEVFYYYYMPAGRYKAVIENTNTQADGLIQFNSKYVEWESNTIPINSLTYPDVNPSQFVTLEFDPDEYYPSLKQGMGIGFNITSLGQYRLNITVLASDHIAAIPTLVNPSAVVFYNDSDAEYYDYSSAMITQNQSIPVFTNTDDELYIAFPNKWHDMHFNLSQLGNNDAGQDLFPYVWDGGFWDTMSMTNPMSDEFESNETWISDIYGDPDFTTWQKGCDFDIPNLSEEDFYWMRIYCGDGYGGGGEIVPYLDLIQLSNITISGDLNLALVRDSGYNYSDSWMPLQPSEPPTILINQEPGNLLVSDENWLFTGLDPRTIGFEEGHYKLLIIPENWDYSGSIKIQLAIENYWDYNVERSFTITEEPLAYPWQIGNLVNVSDPILYNYSTYPYDFTVTYNDTETSWDDGGFVEAYIAVDCYGTAFSWTQLVVETSNVSDYELYLLQDFPWNDNTGPNNEVELIGASISGNNTIEFGVIRDNFTLLFEIFGDGDDLITFKIGIRQYNTTELYTNEVVATYTPPSNGLGGTNLVLILAIILPAIAGAAIVTVFVLKKKGKILTKTPGKVK